MPDSGIKFLGLGADIGRIAPGYRANLALARADMTVTDTWIDGVHEAAEQD